MVQLRNLRLQARLPRSMSPGTIHPLDLGQPQDQV
jgi:hypothetical protein